jgi:hypothetical protein
LQNIFLQHFAKGRGVGIIEPHHDLSFQTLSYLVGTGFFRDPRAFERLVYIDWGNGAYVPFNVLLSHRSDPHDVALNALEAMLRVWPELEAAPLFKNLFLATMMACLANRLPITAAYKILSDTGFRRQILARVSDELILDTFVNFERLGRDRVEAAGSALRRAFLYSFSPQARYTLGQADNALDFRRWMDDGVSFIINLGNIKDHETCRLIGALVLVQVEQAALSRADVADPGARRPFTLLVDEWPSFGAHEETIATILSQARKFNLRLYLAAQSLSQLSTRRLIGAAENCKLSITFGLGRDSAETQARAIGAADPLAIKEEGLTETQHAQYLSIQEQYEAWTRALQDLPARTCYVKLHNRPAVRIKTTKLTQPTVAQHQLDEVLAYYRRHYQRSAEQVEQVMIKQPDHITERASDSSTPTFLTSQQILFDRAGNVD